jgi:hypothetical protein
MSLPVSIPMLDPMSTLPPLLERKAHHPPLVVGPPDFYDWQMQKIHDSRHHSHDSQYHLFISHRRELPLLVR